MKSMKRSMGQARAGVALTAAGLLVAGLVVGLGGCAQQPAAVQPAVQPAPQADRRAVMDEINDPCANRLHDIAGMLLEYYVGHRQLPPELSDLKQVAAPDGAVPLTCPLSGLPYEYVPAGLRVPGHPRLLVVYDAKPVHDGMRWGLFMSEPKGRTPLGFWVAPLEETALRHAEAATQP